MNPQQCRMARAGMALSINDLGKLAGIRVMTISKFERGHQKVLPRTVEALRTWFVAQGVEFINGGATVGARVPRLESLAEKGAALKDAKAMHRKLTNLIRGKRAEQDDRDGSGVSCE